MMFIIRTSREKIPSEQGFTVRMARRTPAVASGGTWDFFCDGDMDAAKQQDLNVVSVHDGWYAGDSGGGVAIWGQGRFWEIRDTPFMVKETSDGTATASPGGAPEGEIVNVRKAIFGV